MADRNDRTHVKDTKDPTQVLHPVSNGLIVALSVEKSRDRVSSAPFDDVPLDLGHSPAVGGPLRKSPHVGTAGSAYIVNRSIALRTG